MDASQRSRRQRRGRRQSGNAMVELALMSPWIFFLFIGIFDFGFYAYSVICVQNAARAAAMQSAASQYSQNSLTVCDAVWHEMDRLPNVPAAQNCGVLPVLVLQKTLCGSTTDTSVITTCYMGGKPTSPTCADCAVDTSAASSQVTVTYQSPLFVPIPGLLTNQLNITRIAEMRIIAE